MKRIGIIISVQILLMVGFAQSPEWQINPANYQYSMTITGVANIACTTSNDTSNMIGAFINGNLAGYAKFNTAVNGANLAYLIVYSNTAGGDTINFQLYDAANDVLISTKNSVIYQENATIGNAANPYVFKTNFLLEELSISNDTIYEYYVSGDTVCNFTLSDETGAQVAATYSFYTDSVSGADNGSFAINGNTLVLDQDVDYNNQDSYHVHILATAASGCTMDKSMVIYVINSNVPPTDIQPNPAYINENEPVATLVTVLEAIDASPNDNHTFELLTDSINFPDNQAFLIQGDELQSNTIFDFETQNQYTLQIKVTDNLQNSYVDTFTVFINDVIEIDDLKAPNFLSPNGDNVNDYFAIPNVQLYSSYALYIYNDNGNLVYSKESDYDNTWNGISNNGKELPMATYYYYFVNNNNEAESFKGKIFIQRDAKF